MEKLLVGIQKFTEQDIINKKVFHDKLICGICLEVLHEPQMCVQCKQNFCLSCVQTQQLKYNGRCPQRCHIDGNWRVTKSNKKTLADLKLIKVRCKEPNCKQTISLGNYMSHYKNKCKEVFTYCENLGCTQFTKKEGLKQHQLECDMAQQVYNKKVVKSIDQLEADNFLRQIQEFNEQKQYQKALEVSYEYGLKMQYSHGKYFMYLPTLIYQIGVIYFNLNKYKPALNNLLKFEEVAEPKIENRYFKDIQDHYTDVLFTIGYLYEELSQYEKAANYYERSLKQDISLHLNEDMSVLINLGHAYRLIGNFQKSRDFCTWAIKLYNSESQYESNENKHHKEDLWKVYHNLTYAQYKYGDITESQKCYKELVKISEEIHGKECNQYCETILLNSQIQQEVGEHDSSEKIIRDTICRRKKILEQGHNDIIYSQRKLVQFLTKKLDFKQARKVITQCLKEYSQYKNSQKDSWKYDILQYELSKVYFREGLHYEEEAQYLQEQQLQQGQNAKINKEIQVKMGESKSAYENALKEAEVSCNNLLKNSEVQCMHSRIIQCLGLIYQKNNEEFKCLDYFFKAKSMIINSFGKLSYKHAKILGYIAAFFSQKQNYVLAWEYINESYEISNNLFITNHPVFSKLEYQKAQILKDQCKQEQSQDNINKLKESLRLCIKIINCSRNKKQSNQIQILDKAKIMMKQFENGFQQGQNKGVKMEIEEQNISKNSKNKSQKTPKYKQQPQITSQNQENSVPRTSQRLIDRDSMKSK